MTMDFLLLNDFLFLSVVTAFVIASTWLIYFLVKAASRSRK